MKQRMQIFAAVLIVAISISGGCYLQEGDETTIVPTEPPPPELVHCVAGFSWEQTPGSLVVSFINQTTPSACSEHRWTFGDGTGSSRETSPAHAYPTAGTYVARLTSCPTPDFTLAECSDVSQSVIVSDFAAQSADDGDDDERLPRPKKKG